jgi:hypothetical protein
MEAMSTPQARKAQTGEPTTNGGHFGSAPERPEATTTLADAPIPAGRDEYGSIRTLAGGGRLIVSRTAKIGPVSETLEMMKTLNSEHPTEFGAEQIAAMQSVIELLAKERIQEIDDLLTRRDPRDLAEPDPGIAAAAEAIGLTVRAKYPTAAAVTLDLVGDVEDGLYFRPSEVLDTDGNVLHELDTDWRHFGEKLMNYTAFLDGNPEQFLDETTGVYTVSV